MENRNKTVALFRRWKESDIRSFKNLVENVFEFYQKGGELGVVEKIWNWVEKQGTDEEKTFFRGDNSKSQELEVKDNKMKIKKLFYLIERKSI